MNISRYKTAINVTCYTFLDSWYMKMAKKKDNFSQQADHGSQKGASTLPCYLSIIPVQEWTDRQTNIAMKHDQVQISTRHTTGQILGQRS